MCWRFQFRTLLGMFPIVLVTAVVIYIYMFTAYMHSRACWRVDLCDGDPEFNASHVRFRKMKVMTRGWMAV